MYTDDEVEEIREEKAEAGTDGSDSRTSVKRLSVTFLMSLLALSLVAYLALGTGTAAVVVSGAGGFYAEIDQINANGAWIYPTVAQTATCPSTVTTSDGRPEDGDTALPLLRVDLAGASIPAGDSVRFIKSINTPNVFGINTFSVVVQQGNNPGSTQLDDTTVLVTELSGENLGLGETIANESYSQPAGNDPPPRNEIFGPSRPNYFQNNGLSKNLSVLGEFAIKGETGSVTNAQGIAHLVAFESLRIPDLNLTIAYDQYQQYEPSGGCPV
jgi:hypothetical protein